MSATKWSVSRQDAQIGRVKVSDRLSRLMADTRRPDGQLWTISNLTDELTSRGHEVSRQYLSNLVQGHRENPPLRLLEALADVFSVPLAYFSDDYLGRVTNDLLPLLVALQDPKVRGLLTRPDLPEIAEVLADADRVTATPEVRDLMARQDLPQVAGSVLDPDFLAWVGTRPLDQVLSTLRAPVVQSAIEETLANWLKYGTGPR
jgi:transcriptional regulator with XRE-family HTH domain